MCLVSSAPLLSVKLKARGVGHSLTWAQTLWTSAQRCLSETGKILPTAQNRRLLIICSASSPGLLHSLPVLSSAIRLIFLRLLLIYKVGTETGTSQSAVRGRNQVCREKCLISESGTMITPKVTRSGFKSVCQVPCDRSAP